MHSFSFVYVSPGVKPVQYRQLYMRFKSSIALGKKQLSKFGGHIVRLIHKLVLVRSRHMHVFVLADEVKSEPVITIKGSF